MTPRFQHALEALYGRERHKDKLGLDGTRALLAALGDPHRRFRSVHVAGTNGKGSVCALVERVLREAGYRTGLFTSPHLVDFRERIRVSGRWVDQEWLERMLERIAALPEGKDRTFFEVCTALGFAYFAEQGVEWAVVEVGLGGRLDCTNVLEPDVTVITSIGLDHTEILGDTIAQIAREKAGILKPNVPVVIGSLRGASRRVIEEIAAARRASSYDDLVEPHRSRYATPRAPLAPWRPLPKQLPRRIVEGPNTQVALLVLEALVDRGVSIPWEALSRGLDGWCWPGRLEACPTEPRLWWDGAHNVSAAMHLCTEWQAKAGAANPAAVVVAFSRDKDVAGFFRVLARHWAEAVIVTARSRNERAMDPATIAEHARSFDFRAVESSDVPTGVRLALELAGEKEVLLTGSLFAVGEAMEAFGGAPGELL